MEKFLENIKSFRELKSLTREQLAHKLGMSPSGYSKIERGEVELTVNKLFKISEVLEVEIGQILNFDAKEIFNTTQNKVVNGVKVSEQHNHFPDEYKDRFVDHLIKENEHLKKELIEILKTLKK